MKRLFYLYLSAALIISGCSNNTQPLAPLTQPVENMVETAANRIRPVNAIQSAGIAIKNEDGKFVLEIHNKKLFGKLQKTDYITYKYSTLGGGLFPYPHSITEEGKIYFGKSGDLIFLLERSYVIVGKWKVIQNLREGQKVEFTLDPHLEVKFFQEDSNSGYENFTVFLNQKGKHNPESGKPLLF